MWFPHPASDLHSRWAINSFLKTKSDEVRGERLAVTSRHALVPVMAVPRGFDTEAE